MEPYNMSHGALQHVPWSPTTCPMEPYNMSHGALQHVPWSPCNYVPWTPCNMSHRNISLATCLQHVSWSPRNVIHETPRNMPWQHVPWSPRNMSHGALATCPICANLLEVTWCRKRMECACSKYNFLAMTGLAAKSKSLLPD